MIRTADPLANELTWALERARPPRLRSYRAWAEEELVLPDGPHKGLRFRVDRQPWTGLWLDALDDAHWLEYYVTGPSQSGKTLMGFCLPALYQIAELRENYGVGLPDSNMANDKWKIDLRPVFEASPKLRPMMPQRGPGSRNGGVKDSIEFANGTTLKFFTAGGDDTSKAGFTLRALGVTEAARFSQSTETSVETDPLGQLKARLKSYERERRRLYVEGTLTVETELPWSAKETTSRSRLEIPCPHCEKYFEPLREHLVGFQHARDEHEAMEITAWYCPNCGQSIDDDERKAVNREVRLVHEGQKVDRRGRVRGEPVRSRRLWFHYRAFHNQFATTADLAEQEYHAAQHEEETQEWENAEKSLCQFVHSTIFVPRFLGDTALTDKQVRRRQRQLPRGMLPANTEYLTMGVDLGKWTSWWKAIAFLSDRRLHVPGYGALDGVTNKSEDVEVRLLNMLRELRDTIVETGFVLGETGGTMVPGAVWIDSGAWGDVVFKFIREKETRDAPTKFMPVLGRGRSQLEKYKYNHPARKTTEVVKIGNHWHVRKVPSLRVYQTTLDADYWKRYVHERLSTEQGQPGSMEFYAGGSMEHNKMAKHLTSEKFVRRWEPGKGMIEEWEKSGANHWLDCSAYACAAGDSEGFRITGKQPTKPPPAESDQADPQREEFYSRRR